MYLTLGLCYVFNKGITSFSYAEKVFYRLPEFDSKRYENIKNAIFEECFHSNLQNLNVFWEKNLTLNNFYDYPIDQLENRSDYNLFDEDNLKDYETFKHKNKKING